jgi:hypothetical protein
MKLIGLSFIINILYTWIASALIRDFHEKALEFYYLMNL